MSEALTFSGDQNTGAIAVDLYRRRPMSIIPAETDKSGNERLTATAPEFVEMLEAEYSKEGKTPGPGKSSTPGEIRTHDLRIRNPMLYPAELRGLVFLIRFSAIKGIGFANPNTLATPATDPVLMR